MERRVRNSRGAALVEFAIVAVLFLMLMFGIMESGLLIKDYLAINQAVREGARTAAIGEITTAIVARVLAAAPGTGLISSNVTLEKSASGTGGWSALGDVSGQNDAATGYYIRVSVRKQHQWITGFFSTSPTTLVSQMVTRRE